MDWLGIGKSIIELGILTVIAALFLHRAEKSYEEQNDMTHKLFEMVVEQIKKCSGGHVLTEDEDRTAVKIDNMINSYLQSAVTDLNASRAMVARYHNGGKDMNAISFLKVSVTNESVNRGYQPVIADFQNQFRAMVGYPIAEIDRTGHCLIRNIEEIKDADIGTYELLKARGVRSVYCHKLTNATGYVIGAVLILYNNDNNYKEDADYVDRYISHMADKISGLMNVRDN